MSFQAKRQLAYKLQPGDHIAVDRKGLFMHHGIVDGSACHVISYRKAEGVERQPMEDFAAEDNVYLCRYFTIFGVQLHSRAEIVARAEQRLGERQYDLRCNNCGQFAVWCSLGEEVQAKVLNQHFKWGWFLRAYFEIVLAALIIENKPERSPAYAIV